MGPKIERRLIGIFVNGLRDDRLKIKLLRDNPDTLQRAITLATIEQNLRKRVSGFATTEGLGTGSKGAEPNGS